jgi:hypothetical protein
MEQEDWLEFKFNELSGKCKEQTKITVIEALQAYVKKRKLTAKNIH